MRLLVLGGTGFLGYHAVTAAISEGHEVSVFTRGGEAPADGVEMLYGDRHGDLSALRDRECREWDAVLDTFSDPEAVAETARLFSGSAGAYGFVSGITNYHPHGPRVVDEESPLRVSGDAPSEDPLQERGLAKLGCESAVLREFSGETFIVRPGIMVGPRDPTDRFSWWPARFARAFGLSGLAGTGAGPANVHEVLAPGDPNRPVQFTDARDLALWMVRMLASGTGGIYNAVGPGRREPISEVLDTCRRAAAELAESESAVPAATAYPRPTWVDETFLAHHLEDVTEEKRPLWFPEPQIPFDEVDSSRAIDAGLCFRPTVETARDTLRWLGPRAQDPSNLAAGLTYHRERDLLRAWHGVGP
ncbi:NAD-dependent epimerase/dehydratase family protein [Rubrobacter aplysinae]|uniref:NAD-dependent epimerase/dehydratase family protein n=1 Tax=Rubrobacter aplysinae TaxID=909625 RepID=UPI00064BFE37|nr:NAD-dependent epimerase/dehydratase family protein [Rubrobacter aplysinae]